MLGTGPARWLGSVSELSSKSWNAEFWRGNTREGGSQLHTVPKFQCRQFMVISVHPESPSYVVLLETENHAAESTAYDCMCCGAFLKIICFTLVFPQGGWIFTPTSAASISSRCIFSLRNHPLFPRVHFLLWQGALADFGFAPSVNVFPWEFIWGSNLLISPSLITLGVLIMLLLISY